MCGIFLTNSVTAQSKSGGVFLSGYDLQKYTDGTGKLLGLHSHTVQEIGKEYVTRRKQFKKAKLNWRKSGGVRRSLGWIPIKTGACKWKNGQVFHNGHYFNVWDSYGLSQCKFRSASFSEDARGRWYFNVVVDVAVEQSTATEAVGIDLGCKEAATSSQGDKLLGRHYRALEAKLGIEPNAPVTRSVLSRSTPK
jgi:putative transposase